MDAVVLYLQNTTPAVQASVALGLLTAGALGMKFSVNGGRRRGSNPPPGVPGLPLIGNLHQLKEKKPHLTFARWAEEFGPIYSIKTGSSTVVVLNSIEVAKEAMVSKFSSISTRKLSKALEVLTCNKTMVATSDYGEFHKLAKRCILTSLLGPNAQKQQRGHRDVMVSNMLGKLHIMLKGDPNCMVNFRELFKDELFSLSMKEAIGKDVESIYVEELNREISKKELYEILVVDPMMGAIDVDWRDFFPYLKWVPNKKLENKIQKMARNKYAVTKTLINEQKKRIAKGEEIKCYLDYLLCEKNLNEEQITTLIWEAIIESSDTTAVLTEWIMYELAKNPAYQDRLYQEIEKVCRSTEVTEENLPELRLLNSVFHETLRRHSPVPVLPLRFVHEDTQIGGFDIPSGTEIAINVYACNMNTQDWNQPNDWIPERFLEASAADSSDLYRTMAFGAGKRACSGSIQVMLISCISVARFVQGFEWRLREGDEDQVDTMQLTAQRVQPLCVFVKPRERN
ncbi:hypothetical protein LUZ60_012352 [Juncus effusus]|nr:hypothetical protein LUZ60_012352 [Juncus effusus]